MLLWHSQALAPHPRFLIGFKFMIPETEMREGALLARAVVHRTRKDRKRERKGDGVIAVEDEPGKHSGPRTRLCTRFGFPAK